MDSLQKTVAFLLLIGFEKASRVMALMDNDEIKNLLAEFNTASELTANTQKTIWNEFCQLGYEAQMNPVETLFIIRQVFDGKKIIQ